MACEQGQCAPSHPIPDLDGAVGYVVARDGCNHQVRLLRWDTRIGTYIRISTLLAATCLTHFVFKFSFVMAASGSSDSTRAEPSSWLSMASSLLASSIESAALEMIKPFIDSYVVVDSLSGNTMQFDGSALILNEVVRAAPCLEHHLRMLSCNHKFINPIGTLPPSVSLQDLRVDSILASIGMTSLPVRVVAARIR